MAALRLRHAVALIVVATSCEAIVGADFDAKRLAPSTGGAGPAGGDGGSTTSVGGSGGDPLLADGSPCSSNGVCASGFCVDDVCCDASCGGECQRCDLSGNEGECTGLPALSDCPVTAGGVCDGTAFCATGAHRYSAGAGDGADEVARGCGFRPDGEFWVGGHFGGELDVGGATPLEAEIVSRRVFLARFGVDGSLSFQTELGDDNPLSDDFQLDDLAVGPDGSVALVGVFDGEISACSPRLVSSGSDTAFVIKLDPNGACVWGKTYEAAEMCSAGGTPGCDWPLRVGVSESGAVVVAGSFMDWVDYGDGQMAGAASLINVFVAHHADDGELVGGALGTATNTSAAPSDADFAGETPIVSGVFGPVGETMGTLTFGGGGMTVNQQEDIFLVSLGESGVWEKSYGDSFRDLSESMAVDRNGDIVIAASFISELDFGMGPIDNQNSQMGIMFDLGLGKLSSEDGSALWPAVGFGPFGAFVSDPLRARIATDGASNVAVAGLLREADVLFDGQSVPSQPDNNFLVKLNANADVLWANAFGILDPPGAESLPLRILKVAGGPRGEVGLCGYTTNTVDFGGGEVTPAGGRDLVYAVFEN